MSSWSYAPEIAGDAGAPAYLRIARAIAADISRGRLRSGDRLPGSRTLAAATGVHRNTAIAAYDELAAQGWIGTRPAGGTYVAADIPVRPPAGVAPAGGAGLRARHVPLPAGHDDTWLRAPEAARPGMLALASGLPDLRLLPVDLVARAYRRVMRRRGQEVLGYGDPRGHARLRAELAAMLAATRGLAVDGEGILVTRGCQMALDLVARAMLGPSSVVAVEALGYRPAWDALRLTGARLVPVPVDGQGMRPDALEAVVQEQVLAAAYVTPHHQYPTTAVLAPGRRLALLDLARRHGFTILEDDYDNEFHYGGQPVLPLASADPGRSVVYLGTLSKILAPGLRIGFVAADPALLARMTAIRLLCDRQGDLAIEAAVAELLADGDIQRHAHRMRRTYRSRRDALLATLERELAGALAWSAPQGGMAVWARVTDGTDAEEWARRGLERGVQFSAASRFTFEGDPPPCLRLGFASLDEDEIREAVGRMAACKP